MVSVLYYYIILYCIVLYCIVLYCIVLYCIVLYCIVLYCIVLYCIVLYCIVLYCIVLYCIILYYIRVVIRSPRFSWSLLKSLHWLPVHYRIIFKICTITYEALSSTQPAYLNSRLSPARNSRQLRSASSNPLYIRRVKTNAGTRAFSVAAPTVWISLPVSVKSEGNIVSFRRRLKTHFFNAAYRP
ncbi:hypothetical protein NP493_1083g00017 [Ridgeia piscesae]|uniref:Uncharacterized protein n=1 Tax=Ridgeia piscesae TaxID=27915 RepID=A0AAD9NL79_RIDPI|nr:hypothetical protein NP493_1083g00017 [Ridgeia piscesae]